MAHSSKPARVLLLAGLDNSGKTSIAYSLRGTRNLPSFCKTKPTVRRNIVSIKAYDSEYIIWDLGGQEAYRDEYLEKFENYFKGLDKFIYVFDIQDCDRYDLALEYYKKIINLLKERNDVSDFEVSIFLHKFDPDLSTIRPDITDAPPHEDKKYDRYDKELAVGKVQLSLLGLGVIDTNPCLCIPLSFNL